MHRFVLLTSIGMIGEDKILQGYKTFSLPKLVILSARFPDIAIELIKFIFNFCLFIEFIFF